MQADLRIAVVGRCSSERRWLTRRGRFFSYTELMALIFLVQRILLHEAMEIAGARKYVEHNVQGASRLQRNQQYCQPMVVTEGTEMVMLVFSATNYRRYHKRAQYEPEHIRWEMRKCLAALVLPPPQFSLVPQEFRHRLLGLWCLLWRHGIKVHDSMDVLLPRAVSEADDLLPLQQSGRAGQKRVS